MSTLAALLLSRLENRFEAVRDVLAQKTSGIFSLTLCVPQLSFDGLLPLQGEVYYWSRPNEGLALLGYETVTDLVANGENRLTELAGLGQGKRADWICLDPDLTGDGPVWFGGFPFEEGSEAAMLHLPLLLLKQQGEQTSLTLSCVCGPDVSVKSIFKRWRAALKKLVQVVLIPVGAQKYAKNEVTRVAAIPSQTQWQNRVEQAIEAIERGTLAKVVLSRRVELEATENFDIPTLVSCLLYRYANCTVMVFPLKGKTIVAATPERLVGLSERQVQCDALAGTHEKQSTQLPGSAKDQHEHRLVIDMIKDRLSPLCDHMDIQSTPEVMGLQNLSHLRTPIRARANAGVSLLDLAQTLHPTPAVGGTPRRAALNWLAQQGEERCDWYSGAFGWMSPTGDGDLNVVLRCASLSGNRAVLSAGAGIVAGSTPSGEWQETEWKLQAMLDALTEAQ